MQKVYIMVCDNNIDGSTTPQYFTDRKLMDKLTSGKYPEYAEAYKRNENIKFLIFPDDFDLASCGIFVMTADHFDFDGE